MKEQFVDYKTALKLKELGFGEECLLKVVGGKHVFLGGYDYEFDKYEHPKEEQPMFFQDTNPLERNPLYEIKVPLYQQVFDWFRNSYGLQCYILDETSTQDGEVFYVPVVDGNYLPDEGTYEIAKQKCVEKLIHIIETNK